MESQEYNPFGGSGGGAPNRRAEQNGVNMRNMSQPNQVRMGGKFVLIQRSRWCNTAIGITKMGTIIFHNKE